MPESKKVFGKIIFDKHSGKLLGAQFLGNNEVIGYADLVSMMINNSIAAKALANTNYNYTPPYSPFINILSVLGRKIEKGA
jgi:pyruvate/2-oxoglutarate dehydrogenase complex dihydrolipoamide dehydrogenase (E3) component